MKKYLSIFMVLIAVLSILRYIYLIRDQYLKPFDYDYLSEVYSNSQYVKGNESVGGIGDDGLYAFAGYYYITGGDPSSVNFEHPPLGKYLIGLSILLFNNENIIFIVFGLLVLYFVYKLALLLTQNVIVGYLSIFLLSIDPFYLLQLKFSLLDLPLTLFTLLGLYFFLKGEKKKKYFWYSSASLGLAFSAKFFPFLIILIPVLTVYLFNTSKKHTLQYLKSTMLIPVIYVASYFMYFVYHLSIIDFVKYQWWIVKWRLGNPVVFGNIFRVIYTGSYKPWFPHEGLVKDGEWTIFLPILLTLAFVSIFRSKKNKWYYLVYLVCVIYMIYLTVNTVGVARYTLTIYPFISILAAYTLLFIFEKVHRHLKINEKRD